MSYGTTYTYHHQAKTTGPDGERAQVRALSLQVPRQPPKSVPQDYAEANSRLIPASKPSSGA